MKIITILGVFFSCFLSQIATQPVNFASSMSPDVNVLLRSLDPQVAQIIQNFLRQGILEYKPIPSTGDSDIFFQSPDKRPDEEGLEGAPMDTSSGDTIVDNFDNLNEGPELSLNDQKFRRYLAGLLSLEDPDRKREPIGMLHWIQNSIPNIQCRPVEGVPQYHCPTPDSQTREWSCISHHQLCDGMSNCPNSEDEDRANCMFYKVMKSNVEILATNMEWFNQSIRKLNKKISNLRNPLYNR